MAIVVETGEGLPNANSYISADYAKSYWDERGKDHSAKTDEQIEEALVRASQYLTYSLEWRGFRKNGRTDEDGYQGLAWPRYYVLDGEGYETIDEVPREVQYATAEVAFYELENPDSLQPAYILNERIKSLKAGDVTIMYDTTFLNAQSARPVLLMVRDLVSQFIVSGFGNRLTARRIPA